MVRIGATPPRLVNPRDTFNRECQVFSAYLLGVPPTAFVLGKYAVAHRVSTEFASGGEFDDFLVRAAARHRVFARMADAYARVFAPGSLLRRKLILLLAILETCPRTGPMIDTVPGATLPRIVGRVGLSVLASVASLGAGVLLFQPVRFWMVARTRAAAGLRATRVSDHAADLATAGDSDFAS
jgi:hypothetical protein